MSKKSQLTRSVSIIGVGQTKYGDGAINPELKDMSLYDMATTACAQAMEDAGVNPRQIGKMVLGMVCGPAYNGGTLANNHGMLEFLGMKGKAGVYHNEVCATAMNCFNEAVEAVASGKYDIAICLDTDSVRYTNHPDMPACFRFPSNRYAEFYGKEWAGGATGNDTAYTRYTHAYYAQGDAPARHYIRENGITAKDFDDAMIGAAITSREHASRNPKAYQRERYQDIAKSRGFDDVWDYMRSKYNPKFTEYDRAGFSGPMDEGATAIIVCATELAGQFKQKPIEIVGTVQCDMNDLTPAVECAIANGAASRIYDVTGYKPEDIEYLQTSDMSLNDALYSAEAVGYLPKGEGWKYMRDGLTRFDSVKPMNTDGGHPALGHAFSASQMATLVEPVLQMRGQAGERQIANPPKIAMWRGQGSYQSTSITILRTVEGVNEDAKPAEHSFQSRPYVRMFYDAIKEGKFIGSRCPKCGRVEFPLYPICNGCGNLDNEIVEVSGNATVKEVYQIVPAFTPIELAPYAPAFACEAQLEEGSEFMCLIFGITPETYGEYRDKVPFSAKLIPMPDPTGHDYSTFALSVNGAAAVPNSDKIEETRKWQEALKSGKMNEILAKGDGIK